MFGFHLFHIPITRECTRIFDFHTIIIDSYSYRAARSSKLSMTKRIDNPFPYSFIRNRQMLFSFQPFGCTRQRKMLKYKGHCCIKQFEQITLHALIIHKDHFIRSFETCQSQEALWIFYQFPISKQYGCGIV